MIKLKVLLTTVLTLTLFNVYGQNMFGSVGKPDNGQSKTAGGNIVNVDMYTGTGSVNIPIYGYSLSGINLGISLSYNAKGIKVDQVASSVGLGWTLNAGGSITRQVKGLEDEVTTPAKFSTGSYPFFTGRLVPEATFGLYQGLSSDDVDDQESDIFYLDLCGRQLSLQFYLDSNDNLQFITYPKSEIKVELAVVDLPYFWSSDTLPVTHDNVWRYSTGINNPIISGISQGNLDTLLSFKITDEKGNIYFYESGDYEVKEINYSNPALSVNSGVYYPTQKWNLVKLETATGHHIIYTYKYTFIDSLFTGISEMLDGDSSAVIYNTAPNAELQSNPLTYNRNIWKGLKTHLSKITYPNGVVAEFDLESGGVISTGGVPVNMSRCDCFKDFKLNAINIKSEFGTDEESKITYGIGHKYFNTPLAKHGLTDTLINVDTNCHPASDPTLTFYSFMDSIKTLREHYQRGYRLALTEITKAVDAVASSTSVNNYIEPLYEFEYNNIPLPYRGASQKDYYGYYNGESTIPTIFRNVHNFNGITTFPYADTMYLSISDSVQINNNTWVSPLGYCFQGFNAGTGTDHTPDPDSMQAGVLQKIHNGIGGTIEIKYKGDYTVSNPVKQYHHQEYSTSGSPSLSWTTDNLLEGIDANDGLVIDSIIESNIYSNEHTKSTKYSYSGGQRFNRGGYTWYDKILGTANGLKIIFTSYFVGPHEYVHGSNHGFDMVTKKSYGFNNEQLSEEEYYFTNLTLASSPYTNMRKRTGTYFHTFSGQLQKYNMGKLYKYKSYDLNTTNSNRYLKKQVTYEYEDIDETPDNGMQGNYVKGLYSFTHFKGPIGVTNNCGAEVYNNGIVHDYYYPLDYKLQRLKKKTSETYLIDNNQGGIKGYQNISEYEYDDYHNLVGKTTSDSKGDTLQSLTMYPKWYRNWDASLYGSNPNPSYIILTLDNLGLQYPILSETWKIKNGNKDKLINFTCVAPSYSYGVIRFPASFSSKQKSLLDYDDIYPMTSGVPDNSTFIKRTAADFMSNTSETDFGTNLVLNSFISKYDAIGNALEVWSNDRKQVSSAIWDTKHALKLAEATNAEFEDIAFTSFEAGRGNGNGSYESHSHAGNWDYNDDYVKYLVDLPNDKAMTGWYAYHLIDATSGVPPGFISSGQLNNKKYLLSFWCQDAGANTALPIIDVYNNSSFVSNITLTEQNAVGNWKLYSAVINAETDDYISITSTFEDDGFYIDEIRLHPVDAFMSTYTHYPLKGINTINGADQYILYKEYDEYGRYKRTRDLRGKIIEEVETRFNWPDDGSNPWDPAGDGENPTG